MKKNISKVLMISNDFLPMVGGVSNHIMELSRSLVKKGNKVRVLHLCYRDDYLKCESIEGVEVKRIFLAKSLADKQTTIAKIRRYGLAVVKSPKLIKEEIDRFLPDVVHWHDYFHTSLSMFFVRTNCRKICTNHSSGFLERFDSGFLGKFFLKILGSTADIFIAPSEELAQKTKSLGFDCVYIPNGVQIERFCSIDIGYKEKQIMLPNYDGQRIVLAARRFDPKNGLNYLVESIPIVNRLVNFRPLFVFAGGGDPEVIKNIKMLAMNLAVLDQCRFLGSIEYELMPNYINISDIVVMPSLMEAVSLSALEAQACKKLLVATSVGGLKEIVTSKTGISVEAADPYSLAVGIVKGLTMEAPQTLINEAFKQITNKYTWDHVANSTIESYNLS